jgi:hypothetical protein
MPSLRRTLSVVAGAVLGVSALLSSDTLRAQPSDELYVEPTPEAKKAHEEALKLFDAGDFAAALVLFQKAYDLAPSYRILYNIGRASRHTKDYKRSLLAFELYLKDGADELPEERRAEVEGFVRELKGLVGTLEIRVNAEGAKVYVDDVAVGTSPLSTPVLVNAGPRRVKAVRQGTPPVVQNVDVVGGEAQSVSLELDVEGDGDVTPPEQPDEDRPSGIPGSTWPEEVAIGLWIATGAFAVGAGVTGTIALVSSSELEDMRYAGPNLRPPPDSDIQGTADRVDVTAEITNWLIAGAVVTGTAALYFTIALWTAPDPEPTGKTPGDKSATRSEPWRFGIGPMSGSISGTF